MLKSKREFKRGLENGTALRSWGKKERQKTHISFFASTLPAAVVLELPLFKIADTPFAVLSRWAVAGALTGGLCTLSVKDPG